MGSMILLYALVAFAALTVLTLGLVAIREMERERQATVRPDRPFAMPRLDSGSARLGTRPVRLPRSHERPAA